MNVKLKINHEAVNRQTTIFHLVGWFDEKSEEKMLAAAQDAQTQGVEKLILDLEEITMLTSAGIRIIQKTQKIFTPKDSNTSYVRLCNAPPNVYHVLKQTGILQILPVYESLQAALDSYNTN